MDMKGGIPKQSASWLKQHAGSNSNYLTGTTDCHRRSALMTWNRQCIERMRFWEDEGPGITRAIQVLEDYLQ
ncbi:hypothetical protein HYQ44_008975 [Verticillium longisporum]|nr:hypothetical protein HYQ44_008975 [Verticillium longisporum]